MRRCKAKYWDGKSWIWTVGWFHMWAQFFEEFASGPGNYVAALVEEEDGQIRRCDADSVKFDNNPPIGG
jgi:hypothetical protein